MFSTSWSGRSWRRWWLIARARPRSLRWLTTGVAAVVSCCLLLLSQLPTSSRRSGHRQLAAAFWGSSADDGQWEDRVAACENEAPLYRAPADVVVEEILPQLNFNASWPALKTFWTNDMEERYRRITNNPVHPLKIMVVPHSHNDPGWGWTFEAYFRSRTKLVLDSIVAMMPQMPLMRFMWTEISFLHIWWQQASEIDRQTMKDLIASGRLEVTTGGWVMTDEAITTIRSMITQLVEGHLWLRHTFNVSVTSAWAVDVFGHSSTMPFVLKLADINQAVILRTPYVWKEYLAAKQAGDFHWRQQWDSQGQYDLLTHHHPYFMYTTSAACSPFGQSSKMCFNFDFARDWSDPVPWYNQFTHITDENIQERAEMLVGAAGRTASLLPHNVALMMLGADFQFKHAFEWREQYGNYTRLMRYINERTQQLGASIQFATPAEYFSEVRRRSGDGDASVQEAVHSRPSVAAASNTVRRLPTLIGDFHVYSDVFDGRPKYWSGFYTSGPQWKRAARQAEAQLHAVEMLLAWTSSEQRAMTSSPTANTPTSTTSTRQEIESLQRAIDQVTTARRLIALFNHHDAITGTSSDSVMSDFMAKLTEASRLLDAAVNTVFAAQLLQLSRSNVGDGVESAYSRLDSVSDARPGVWSQPASVQVHPGRARRLVVFNALPTLAHRTVELLSVGGRGLTLLDAAGCTVPLVVWPAGRRLPGVVRVRFRLRLPPLTLSFFTLAALATNSTTRRPSSSLSTTSAAAAVGANELTSASSGAATVVEDPLNNISERLVFRPSLSAHVDDKSDDNGEKYIGISNRRLTVLVERQSGLPAFVVDRRSGQRHRLAVSFAAYATVRRDNGKYLFTPAQSQPEKIACDADSLLQSTSRLAHSIRVDCGSISLVVELDQEEEGSDGPQDQEAQAQWTRHDSLVSASAVRLWVDVRLTRLDEDQDVVMLIESDVSVRRCASVSAVTGGVEPDSCGFFTDANSHQMVRRPYVADAGVAGNTYPVTSQTSLQGMSSRQQRHTSSPGRRGVSGGIGGDGIDTLSRLTVLMDRSRGVAHMRDGQLTLTLDRRSSADDGRGIGQPLRSSQRTHSEFLVLLQQQQTAAQQPLDNGGGGAHKIKPQRDQQRAVRLFAVSRLEQQLSRQLQQPPLVRLSRDQLLGVTAAQLPPPPPPRSRRLVLGQLPCDWQLLQWRPLLDQLLDPSATPTSGVEDLFLLSVWRQAVDCSFLPLGAGQDSKDSALCRRRVKEAATLAPSLSVSALVPASLSGAQRRWRHQMTSLAQLAPSVDEVATVVAVGTPPPPPLQSHQHTTQRVVYAV